MIALLELGRGQDTVPLALWLALSHLDDYETAILMAVRAGGDTDTVAAMVGGILAARLGTAAVPGEWLNRVEALPGEFRAT
jgi:ADP-ribosylglycohydrolase